MDRTHNTANPFKIASNLEDNTETEEILTILNKPKTCKNQEYFRGLSRSNPQLYNSKKISLNGRILQSISKNTEAEYSNFDPTLSGALTPTPTRSAPLRPIPQRVSNPFLKNFDILENKFNNDNKFDSDKNSENSEKNF
jgi:hypothetical protein